MLVQFNSTVLNSLNSKYLNLWSQETVLILGNGPSLNDLPLSKTKNKKIITVNNFNLTYTSLWLKSDAHVFIDPGYWQDQIARREIIKRFVMAEEPLILISRPQAWEMLQLIKLANDKISPCLIHPSSDGADLHFDLRVPCAPLGQNVLSAALLFSLFVGTKRIELWGFDHSFMDAEDPNNFEHAYRDGLSPAATPNFSPPTSRELQEKINVRLNAEYSILRKMADLMGCKIINCSRKSSVKIFEVDV